MSTYLDKTVASIVTTILVAAELAMATASVVAQTTTLNAATPAASNPAAPKKNLKVSPTASRKEIKSALTPAELAIAELAIAERVHVGHIPCELGSFVTVDADKKLPGYFNIQGKAFKYRMFPMPTSTGAIRLEDRKSGAVWLQLDNKSMLMNQKLGTRLADECRSPAQLAMAEAIHLNPPPSLLDASKPAAFAAK